ncbi:MAG: hypothetical protein KGN32_00330 [Burkholderiales bacterium]|nr:hypothetical protein [Burkholderiales bacterium]
MHLTRLSLPAIVLLLAMLAWPFGIAVLALVIILDIGVKREWHAIDMIAAGVIAMGLILWLVAKLGA